MVLIVNMAQLTGSVHAPHGLNVINNGYANRATLEILLRIEMPVVRKGQKEFHATFVFIRMFDMLARAFARVLKHGDIIAIEGYIKTDVWVLGDGTHKIKTYVWVDKVHWVWSKAKGTYSIVSDYDKGELVTPNNEPLVPLTPPEEVEEESELQDDGYDVLPDWTGLK